MLVIFLCCLFTSFLKRSGRASLSIRIESLSEYYTTGAPEMWKYTFQKYQKVYSLPDFAGVVGAAFEQMINVVVVGLQCFMLGLGAHAEHRYVRHSLRQLRNGLALYNGTLLEKTSTKIILLSLHQHGRSNDMETTATTFQEKFYLYIYVYFATFSSSRAPWDRDH